MAEKGAFPEVEVAVTLIVRDSGILAVYNREWSTFTLPMTKRRHWNDPKMPPEAEREEPWIEAAARAAAEWLAITVTGLAPLNADVPHYQQSDRNGVWKRYEFRVFRLPLPAICQPRSDAVIQWLTVDDWLNEDRRPISQTARHILRALAANAELTGNAFP